MPEVALRNLHVHLFRIEWFLIRPGHWRLRGVRDSYWRLYRNDQDGATLVSEGTTYSLKAGQLALVPAGVRFDSDTDRDIGHVYAHFDVLGLPSVAAQELFDQPILLPEAADAEHIFDGIAERRKSDIPTDLAMECQVKAALYRSLALYLTAVPPEKMERCGRMERALEPVLPAIHRIEEELAGELSNRLLAQLCCMNEDYFIRRFRACTGKTPVHYIQERRIRMATQKLLFTNLTTDQIAAETGFGSRSYFSRVFTRMTGLSPTSYRKMPPS